MSRRTLQTGALALLLATGTALTSCSSDGDDSATTGAASESATGSDSSTAEETSETSESSESSESSEAPSSSEGDTSSEEPDSEAPDTEAAGDANSNEPVDLDAALLGAEDAPAGFTVAQNDPANSEIPEGTAEMLNAMEFEPAHCKDVLNERIQGGTAETDARTTNYVRGQEATILVAVSPGTETEANECADISANGTVQEVPISIKTASQDAPVTVNGAEQVTGTTLDTTIGIAGQESTVSQTTITGVSDGASFTVMGGGDVDQATLVSVAEAQAQRLQG